MTDFATRPAAAGPPPERSSRPAAPPTLRELVDLGARKLETGRGSAREDPRGEARRLLAAATGLAAADLLLRLDDPAAWPARTRFLAMVTRRAEGVPLQLLTGETGFHDVVLAVEHGVFVPRPETELLVEEALLAIAARRGAARDAVVRVVDVGTGSGAIAIAVAHAMRGHRAEVFAGDVDPHAVRLARANAVRCGVDVEVRRSDLCAAFAELAGTVDVVVSNPPYVGPGEVDRLPVEVRSFDPPRALFDPEGGTGFHRKIAAAALDLLRPEGVLLLEIGETQAAAVRCLLHGAGYADVQVLPDLAGRDRIVRGVRDGRGNPWTPSY